MLLMEMAALGLARIRENAQVLEPVCLPLMAVCCLFFSALTAYRILRPYFHSRVNCWFCNHNDKVDYASRNSWVCKKCDQYNGFTSDGDYNKELNMDRTVSTAIRRGVISHPSRWHNGLCSGCNANQQLKVLRLATFRPIVERKFDDEINVFKKHLEEIYELCDGCQRRVGDKLEKDRRSIIGKMTPETLTHKANDKPTSRMLRFSHRAAPIVTVILLLIYFQKILFEPNMYFAKKSRHLLTSNVFHSFDVGKNFTKNAISYLRIADTLDYFHTHFPSFADKILALDFGQTFKIIDIILIESIPVFTVMGLLMHSIIIFNMRKLSVSNCVCLIFWSIMCWFTILEEKHLYLFQVILVLLANYTFDGRYESDFKTSDRTSEVKPIKSAYKINTVRLNKKENTIADDLISCRTVSPPASSCSFNAPYMANSSPVHSQENFSQTQYSDDESELDDSINSLNLGKKKNSQTSRENIFSSWISSDTSLNVSARSIHRRLPTILSPSRFSLNKSSWVAGGYWGSDNFQTSGCDNSRSSSQSSGFESVTSLNNGFNSRSVPSPKYSNINFIQNNDHFVPNVKNNNGLNFSKPAPSVRSTNRSDFNPFNKSFEYTFQPLHRP